MRSMLSRAAALLLLSLPMLALAGGTLPLIPISPTDPADADQLAAPSNAAPNALHVRNDDMIETGGVIWSISGDNTAGATVNGASQYFEVLAPGQVGAPTLTLGPNQGEVFVNACSGFESTPGVYICHSGTPVVFRAQTATLENYTGDNLGVDPGESFPLDAQAFNGDFTADATVTYSTSGPPLIALSPLTTTSSTDGPASLQIEVDEAAPGGTVMTVTATRTDVPNVPPVTYLLTVNSYELNLVSPAPNTRFLAGAVVPLTVEALYNGGPPDNEAASQTVTWQFVQNPNGSTLSSNFSSTKGGTTTGIELTVGSPNPTEEPVIVRATAFAPTPAKGIAPRTRTIDFVVVPFDDVQFTAVAGENQTALVGQAFMNPLQFTQTRNGLGDGNVLYNWTVSPPGAATLGSDSTTTDANGVTQNTVTAGPNGGPITVTATRADNPAVSYAFALGIADQRLDKPSSGSGDGQIGGPNTSVQLAALATLNGAPQPDVSVTWSVIGGDATVSPPSSASDASGVATTTLNFGTTAGTVTVEARRVDVTTEVETYTLTLQNDMFLIKPSTGSGDGQSAGAGQAVAQPLVAIATLNGTPQDGVAVNWQVRSGDASLTFSSPTGNGGQTSAQVTMGTTPGPIVIDASRVDNPAAVQTYNLTLTDVRTLSAVSGDGQVGSAGATLPQSLVVVARNNGVAAPGVTVQWSVSGDATLSQTQSTTAADGTSGVSLTFGNNGGTVTVTATRADAPTATTTFVVSTEQALLTLESISGDGASGAPGTTVTLVARAMRNGSPESGLAVAFDVMSGDGTLSRAIVTTGSDGVASTQLTLGAPGVIRVRAARTDDTNASVLFTVTSTATPGRGDELTVVSGNNQLVAPGATGSPMVVRFTRDGVPVPGVVVSWSVTLGSATVAPSTSTTDANGEASTGIAFGDTPGSVGVRATAANATAAFSHSIREPDSVGLALRLQSGGGQTGPIGTRADQPLVVEVLGGSGRNVEGVVVNWQVVSGSATLDGITSQSDDGGRASMGLRFGASAGDVVVRASIGDAPTQRVDVTLRAFVPTLRIVSGDGQSAAPGTTLPQDFVIEIGVPGPSAKTLAGLSVRWQVSTGGGSLASATTITDANGRSANRMTLGPAAGVNRATATIDGVGSVTFTANGEAPVQAGPLAIVSGNNQTLPTRTDSAPLVVELRTTTGVPLVGASLLWISENAQTSTARTVTDEQGRASNIAQVLLPGAARVTVQVEGSSATTGGSVVFTLNGGVANIPTLDEPEETVGDAIDQLCPNLAGDSTLTPGEADLLARCLELVNNAGANPGQVEEALVQLQQDIALAQADAALLAAATQFNNVKTRMAALRSGAMGVDLGGLAIANSSGTMPLSFLPSSVVQGEDVNEGGDSAEIGSDFSRWGFFASGTIGRGEHDADSVTPEYDYDTQGLTAGIDYRVNESWIVGASLGYNQQDTEVGDGRGGIDASGWSVSGYTTWYHANNWYLDGVLTFGSNDYDISRSILYDIVATGGGVTRVDQTATGSSGGDQLSLAVSFGRDFQSGAWSYGPYLRGNYTRLEFDGYDEVLESGIGNGLGLSVAGRELKSMTGVVGGKVTYAISRDWGILMPHAQIEWEHEFKDDPQSLVTRFLNDPTRTTIRERGTDVDTDYYNIGFGLSALFPGGRSAFFYYEHLAGSEGVSQDNLSLGVRIEF